MDRNKQRQGKTLDGLPIYPVDASLVPPADLVLFASEEKSESHLGGLMAESGLPRGISWKHLATGGDYDDV